MHYSDDPLCSVIATAVGGGDHTTICPRVCLFLKQTLLYKSLLCVCAGMYVVLEQRYITQNIMVQVRKGLHSGPGYAPP